MWSAFDISASGLAASAASLSTAAKRIANIFTGGPAPNVTPPQPASEASPPSTSVAGSPIAGSTAVAAQQRSGEPASWMLEILKAKAAYRANAAVMMAANDMTGKTIDTIG